MKPQTHTHSTHIKLYIKSRCGGTNGWRVQGILGYTEKTCLKTKQKYLTCEYTDIVRKTNYRINHGLIKWSRIMNMFSPL
jgi:hypothetical protein